ncbi:hypothetical protein C5C24_06020 [Rathayibacter sp. AY2B3]|nr:hypothetical protein C5C24_06020 [Rathayibacter sp. AY2B3]
MIDAITAAALHALLIDTRPILPDAPRQRARRTCGARRRATAERGRAGECGAGDLDRIAEGARELRLVARDVLRGVLEQFASRPPSEGPFRRFVRIFSASVAVRTTTPCLAGPGTTQRAGRASSGA